jgi:hypothetical protein
MADDVTKVLPDKIRRLEARVARLEDGVGMLERAEKRTAIGLSVRDSKMIAAVILAAAIGQIFLISKIRRAANA